MIDTEFNQKLLLTLDKLLEGKHFATGISNEFRDRIYQRGAYGFGLSSSRNSRYSTTGNFMGFDMDFQVDGIINGRSYADYLKDVLGTIHNINQEVSELGIKVDGGAIWDLNHVKKGEVNIKFWHKEGSKPEEVAQAIVVTQRGLFSAMSRYIKPEAVSPDAAYLQH